MLCHIRLNEKQQAIIAAFPGASFLRINTDDFEGMHVAIWNGIPGRKSSKLCALVDRSYFENVITYYENLLANNIATFYIYKGIEVTEYATFI